MDALWTDSYFAGWISYRLSVDKIGHERQSLLDEAEQRLESSIKLTADDPVREQAGRSHSYLGRVLSQQPSKEQFAFRNFQHSIDSGADANTWFGIGELYLQQNQPADALQVSRTKFFPFFIHVSAN